MLHRSIMEHQIKDSSSSESGKYLKQQVTVKYSKLHCKPLLHITFLFNILVFKITVQSVFLLQEPKT